MNRRNSGKPRNSGKFFGAEAVHYCEVLLYLRKNLIFFIIILNRNICSALKLHTKACYLVLSKSSVLKMPYLFRFYFP